MGRSLSYTEQEAREAIASSFSWAESLRRLGMCPSGGGGAVLKRYATEVWRIPVGHFDPYRSLRAYNDRRRRIPLERILVEGSSFSRGHLKARLFAEGLRERRCQVCGQDEEWLGRPMSLILDHINGVRDDHRLSNLQILCPNCAATLDTHCGRNVPRMATRNCERCGETFRPKYPRQRHCSADCGRRHTNRRRDLEARRKVERPPYAQLLAELEATSYVAVGRRYGVSDNAVRKWVRAYERDSGA